MQRKNNKKKKKRHLSNKRRDLKESDGQTVVDSSVFFGSVCETSNHVQFTLYALSGCLSSKYYETCSAIHKFVRDPDENWPIIYYTRIVSDAETQTLKDIIFYVCPVARLADITRVASHTKSYTQITIDPVRNSCT